MSWTPEVYIGEMRPWPESVRVVRGNSGEVMRYDRPERSEDGVDVTCVPDDYTAKLMAELTRVLDERDTLNAKFEVSQGMRHDEHERYTKENASLRDRITTQAQTIQAYRDESREWREVAEHAQAENDKLRELVRDAWGDGHPDRSCDGCDIRDECHDDVERMRKDGVLRFSRCLFELRIEERMRELGIEVD